MDGSQIVLQHLPVDGRRLRIAVVTETYPPEVNGVAVTIGQIIGGLQQRQHQIQLIRPRQHSGDSPAQQSNFEEVLQRGIAIPRYEALKMGLPAKQALFRLWSLKRPDIVHIVTEGPLGWSALAAAQKLKLPVTADFHTNFHSYSKHYGIGWLKAPIIAYMRKFHNKALRTLVPTDSMRCGLAALGFKRLRVVARGVDTQLFNPARRSAGLRHAWGLASDDLAVISVGRIAPEKNLQLTLRAFEAMRAENARARLIIVGDGPELATLRSRYTQHTFAGMRTGEELAAYYASADIFLFPSVTETYGNVTVEAMASGLAVVAYNYAAAAEHVRHSHNGLLAELGNEKEFVRLAAGLINERERIVRLGAAARATTENLDWSCIAGEFESALLETAAENDSHEYTKRASA
jgi:glycosyltransferase involved in cell wall biosynthesis